MLERNCVVEPEGNNVVVPSGVVEQNGVVERNRMLEWKCSGRRRQMHSTSSLQRTTSMERHLSKSAWDEQNILNR